MSPGNYHQWILLLLLLLLSRFSCVWLCATPETAAHQAPPSLGFSRQEYWSELPFRSPMHESEKWKWRHSVVSHSSWPHGLQPTRPLRRWDFPGKSNGVGCHCLLRDWVLGNNKLLLILLYVIITWGRVSFLVRDIYWIIYLWNFMLGWRFKIFYRKKKKKAQGWMK